MTDEHSVALKITLEGIIAGEGVNRAGIAPWITQDDERSFRFTFENHTYTGGLFQLGYIASDLHKGCARQLANAAALGNAVEYLLQGIRARIAELETELGGLVDDNPLVVVNQQLRAEDLQRYTDALEAWEAVAEKAAPLFVIIQTAHENRQNSDRANDLAGRNCELTREGEQLANQVAELATQVSNTQAELGQSQAQVLAVLDAMDTAANSLITSAGGKRGYKGELLRIATVMQGFLEKHSLTPETDAGTPDIADLIVDI